MAFRAGAQSVAVPLPLPHPETLKKLVSLVTITYLLGFVEDRNSSFWRLNKTNDQIRQY